jgi:hypothetical protein
MKRTSLVIKLLFLALLVNSSCSILQKNSQSKKSPVTTAAKKPAAEKEKSPKKIADFIDSTFTSKSGLINIHHKEDKWYFEIPDSLLNREIMCVTRYSRMISGAPFFAGELAKEQVIRFEKGPNDKIFLTAPGYLANSPDTAAPIYQAVQSSDFAPIIEAFNIEAVKADSAQPESYVIDVSKFFLSDIPLFLNPLLKIVFGITSIDPDRSYVSEMKTFPINNEISYVKTYSAKPDSRVKIAKEIGSMSLGFNTSMVLLPKDPMKIREYDPRVGFFWNNYDSFEESSQKVEKKKIAVRWRLEPRSVEDAEKQANGELIEPKKPIVFYIDPATPDQWKPYLKQGIDDWNIAFEEAGWKNAIRGEYWPENDSSMSLMDARYSVIRYLASSYPNAYGPNVNDPRTGEIIESHVGWYHNVMELLHDWYFIQTGAANPVALLKEYPDSIMGELIRFVSSHEIGHTLGLLHNMYSSSATPVEKLRDKEFIEKHGHTASIMDYARFNYVAQPGDGITDFYPRINDYDKWAIKWGYSYFYNDSIDEKTRLNQWVIEAYKNPRLRYVREETKIDPRVQQEDLGDNAMKASAYGIMNLKRIVPILISSTEEDGQDYSELKHVYEAATGQYNRYLNHVLTYVGGVYCSPKTFDMEGYSYETVPENLQKEAVRFLGDYLFEAPKWLLDENILKNIQQESGVELVKKWQSQIIAKILSEDRLLRLINADVNAKSNYTADELLSDLESIIFSEVSDKSSTDIYVRNLQKIYVNSLSQFIDHEPVKVPLEKLAMGFYTNDINNTDFPSIARAHLDKLKSELRTASRISKDSITRYHYLDLISNIDTVLNP